MKVKKFLIFIILTLHVVNSLRIRKPRTKKARKPQISNNQTEIENSEIPQVPINQIIIESATESTTTQTILQKEIQNLIETLKSNSRNSVNESASRERETRKNVIEKPRIIEVEKISEPKHIDLECKFGNASDYLSIEYPGRYLYTCESFNLRVYHENTHIALVLGDHNHGYLNKDVVALRNIFSKTKFIPNGIASFFPNLFHLYIPSSRIQIIRRRNFVGMMNLHTLDLRYNEIEILDNDVFLDLFNLKILALSGNFLKKLPSNAFLNLHNLRYFDVSDNDISFFDDEILSTNLELEEILLDHNRIRNIKTNFEKFKDIGFIDLRGNVCIDTLYLKDHPDYPMLFELQEEINYNCTKNDSRDIKIPSGTADLKSVLSWEICSQLRLPTNESTTTQTILQKEIQNLIETLKSNSRNSVNESASRERETRKNVIEKPRIIEVEKISEPKHIDLECKFGNASDYLSIEYPGRYLYTCESFNLRVYHENTHIALVLGDHNHGYLNKDVVALRNIFSKKKFIPNGIASFFPNLFHLYIPSSRIQIIRRRNFVGMMNLHTLDLRYNEIEILDNDVFLDLFNLKILALSGNFLKKLPSNAFLNLHNLRYFDVSDNEISFFDDEILSTNLELEEILLDHNRIRNIKTNFEKFKDIGFIDLRGNVCIDTLI
ncbi:hypothetical protein PVAND_009296 [Polypedilum vanderplanki]|uniref:Uncharacterized protein n=1 Tax=Polypedilum vanderplanki TaxID=319348 RepID=A0A9J6CCA9_POLVA|nr:hypothetical protein PVAND_009296 [Polypedilum vanderplanki]